MQYGFRSENGKKVDKWSEFLGRAEKKWGDANPLEKATLECLKNDHFLAVKHFTDKLTLLSLSFLKRI